jgi:hypothetical protein
MIKQIVCQKTSETPGVAKSTNKPYVKYGYQDSEDTWYNSFVKFTMVVGGEYEIDYVVGQYGNDLKAVKPLSESSNKTASVNRNSSIIRQHSQTSALMYFQAKGNKDFTDEELEERIIWFDENVEQVNVPF